eukprot:TRINITY_DN2061_c2_g1_i1.p1 TRINITY_DN2061_c2_g1~~TRINITY_DN2061_c2_g1_i1.p1  ORF type:complete len:192 (+),score=46.88 TRINITY_DN2061_c2_g1_i1:81-656(+)
MSENKILKVIVEGDNGVGKSSLIKRYVESTFSDDHNENIEHCSKKIVFRNETITLHFYDKPSTDVNELVTSHYYGGAHISLVLFDLSDKKTIDAIEDYTKKIIRFQTSTSSTEKLMIVIVGNMLDKDNHEVKKEDLELEDFEYFEISVKNNKGINEMFTKILELYYEVPLDEPKNTNTKPSKGKRKGCIIF